MKLYKLTNQDNETYGGTEWGEDVSYIKPVVDDPEMCSDDVYHAYVNKNLALLLNPIHADISDPVLWLAEGDPCISDWGKVGCFSLKTVKQIAIPEWYLDTEIRHKVQIAFAILCAESVLSVYENSYDGDDRPRKAIEAAKEYLNSPDSAAYAAARAAYAAADAAARAADRAAYAAARAAARAADRAAYAAANAAAYAAADAADRAAYAAYAAARAADRAAYAAAYAANAAADAADRAAAYAANAAAIDFGGLADQAVEWIASIS